MAHHQQSMRNRALSSLSSLVITLSIALPTLLMLRPGRSLWAIAPAALLMIAAMRIRLLPAIHVSLFCFLFTGFAAFLPKTGFWPWPLLAPLAVYLALVFGIPRLRQSCLWLKPGRINKPVRILMLVVAVGSVAALVVWYAFTQPDLGRQLSRFPDMPPLLIPLAGIGFALLNAVMEEFAFRGIFMHGLDCAFASAMLSIMLQGMSFGLFHYVGGIPNGVMGSLMAFIYGILLGWIRKISNGLLAPIITHVIADAAIFCILTTSFFGVGT
jgi:membrane protease YdiL (CAAX protease family)